MKTRPYVFVTLNVYWFGLGFMWNALHPIVLPALLLNLVPAGLKNTYLGAMTFVGLVLAMGVQPLAGALSDRTRGPWGRRRPWMVAGTLASLIVLGLMAGARTLGQLVAGYVILQIVSNTAHGPAQGLIPDRIPPAHRGLASGVKNLFGMGGLIATSLVAGRLMEGSSPGLAFLIIGAVLAVAAAITIFTIPPMYAVGPRTSSATSAESLIDRLCPALGRYPAYAKLLLARFLILLGVYVVQSFAQYYIRDWLELPRPAVVTGNLMAAIGVALTVLVFPAGWLSDRIGRWVLNVVAGAIAAAGIFLLVPVRGVVGLYAAGAMIGMATGVFLSVNWALATDLIPQEEAGKYLGLSNLATAGAGAASRFGGPI
ncbi:MAG: MFS transporter, partial [Anaerolineae bacterium]